MAIIDILLPAMGEGVIEATIIQILVKQGDKVEEDDSLIEIATDKVDSEIPSPENGIVAEILVTEGDVVKVGQLIARLTTKGEEVIVNSEVPLIERPEKTSEKISELLVEEVKLLDDTVIEITGQSTSFLSPLVKSIIKKEKITNKELLLIEGTGAEGRITKDDLFLFLNNRSENKVVFEEKKELVLVPKTTSQIANNGDEIIEMDRMRRLIAEHMVKSVQTSPHVTSFVEADVTRIVNWRNKNKDAFRKREGEKITYMPIFIEAMTKAIKDFPMINVSIEGTQIIKKKNINIGMAAALPSGNLIVPVIKNAGEKNLVGLTKSVNDLAERSRNNKLQPDEIQGSTITITNLGSFGNIAGTPIINQPNVAILAVGAIVKKPAVIETPEGDTIGIRHKMILSLAYDHRVVDGALGGMFLKRISDYLESFNMEDLE